MKSTSTSAATTAAGIQDRVHRMLEEELKVDGLSADTDLFEAGFLDSLGFVELLVRIEKDFGRRIALEDLEIADFRSIAAIAAFLSREGDGT